MGLGFCCCCIPAKIGVIIMDVACLLMGIYQILAGTVLVHINEFCNSTSEALDTYVPYEETEDILDDLDEYCDTLVEPIVMTIGSGMIIYGALVLLISAMHIVGSVKEKTCLMWPMLIWQLLGLVFSFLLAAAVITLTALYLSDALQIVGYVFGGILVVITLILSYFVTVFFKFRKKVAKKQDELAKSKKAYTSHVNKAYQPSPGHQMNSGGQYPALNRQQPNNNYHAMKRIN